MCYMGKLLKSFAGSNPAPSGFPALPLALEPSGPPALDFSPHAHVSPCPHAPSRLRRAQANR